MADDLDKQEPLSGFDTPADAPSSLEEWYEEGEEHVHDALAPDVPAEDEDVPEEDESEPEPEPAPVQEVEGVLAEDNRHVHPDPLHSETVRLDDDSVVDEHVWSDRHRKDAHVNEDGDTVFRNEDPDRRGHWERFQGGDV